VRLPDAGLSQYSTHLTPPDVPALAVLPNYGGSVVEPWRPHDARHMPSQLWKALARTNVIECLQQYTSASTMCLLIFSTY